VWLRKAEAQEALVQEKLLEAHAQLEERVAQRTAELARTTEELAAREVLLRQFVRHTPAAVAMLDKNLCYLQASDRWVQDYNLSEREIIGKSHYDIFPETPQHWKDVNQRVLAGAVERCEEAALPRPDGSVDWLQWEARPWLDAKGEVAGLILYTQVITERKRAEAETEALNQQFLETSRRAGMAEVATSVLHNVGNVLNSVNISSSIISEKLRKSPIDNVSRIAGLVRDNAGDLPRFFSEDPVGQKLPQFLGTLSARLEEEQQALLAEIASLRLNVEHIKEIVNVQQDYAKNIEGVREKLSIWDLVEDALRITGPGLEHHRIEVIRHFADSPRIPVEKHKVLAILVNLIKNAKHALTESEVEPKRLSFTVTHTADELTLCVNDNGIGIAPENITRIFVHGFTTRKSGHGFGLHSGALAAREMRGRLCAHSDGPGCGADFFLTLPCRSDDDAFAALNS
jgi:PAS domain S-box-containing protein